MTDVMKNLIGITLLTIIISSLIIACNGGNKSGDITKLQKIGDSETENIADVIRGRIIEDTVIGHWTIKATKDSNDIVVGRHDWAVKDSSVFLTLFYDRNIVYSDKEIRTKDVVGSEGEYIMQWGGEVFWVSDSAIYLSFGCFLPDTDDGWNMLYQILPDGKSNIIVIDVYMGIDGFDVVADIMALYLNERAVGASSADLKRLYEQYCSKELAEELSAATFPIVSDNTDFRHAYKTIQIEPQDGFTGLPLEKYSFEVKFKPYHNDDNVTDILYMEVDGTTNKIIKIDSGERKVI
ncbi:hypothetical protein IMSAG192_00230 [Muribaculaceae bacterium]|nr:hypothetical protein IMSAG192_00230 [Muribaculaceae bacterium]